MNLRREPVMLLSGVISAGLILLLGLGVEIPEGAEGALQAAVAAVAGLVAAWRVRKPGQPKVIVGGIVSALVVIGTTFGVEIPEAAATGLQAVAALVVSWIVRRRVTPVEGGE